MLEKFNSLTEWNTSVLLQLNMSIEFSFFQHVQTRLGQNMTYYAQLSDLKVKPSWIPFYKLAIRKILTDSMLFLVCLHTLKVSSYKSVPMFNPFWQEANKRSLLKYCIEWVTIGLKPTTRYQKDNCAHHLSNRTSQHHYRHFDYKI